MIIAPRRRILLENHPLEPNTSFAFKEFRKWTHFPFNWHYHPEIELTMIVKGRGLRFVVDSIQDYREGDLCLLGSNTPHTWQSVAVPGQTVHSIVIIFKRDFLGPEFLERPEARHISELLERSKTGLVLSGKTRQTIAAQMLKMCRTPRGSFQHVLDLLSMLSTIAGASARDCQALGTCTINPETNKDAHRRLTSVLNYIDRHPEEIPPQSEVAREVRLSPAAFSRFFKRCVGKTYVSYLNELRIGRACRALIETDLNITEIAYSAGFNNLSNFNRRFRAMKRITPRAFRNLTRV
jgi:AraC-like DNA-binding protein/quercetin dioxygenase-like cupin family protein